MGILKHPNRKAEESSQPAITTQKCFVTPKKLIKIRKILMEKVVLQNMKMWS